jgi:hypothetical protein
MNSSIQLTKRVSPTRNSVSHSLPLITYNYPATPKVEACSLRRAATEGGSLLTVLLPALCCVALSVQAVTPAPDGAYPGANTAEGQNALQSLSSGIHNTALGYQTLFSDTTGHDNMATGFQALFSNSTGNLNTATGSQALFKNTTGNDNTAAGFRALYSNTTGLDNTANGFEALAFNTTGQDDMANGFKALYNNTTGNDNTATGYEALQINTTGSFNTANGVQALNQNTTGYHNAANGSAALLFNTTGHDNTANGFQALLNNRTGSFNMANGDFALFHNTSGSVNIALGDFAGGNLTTGDSNIDIGNPGVAGEADTIRIGFQGNQSATFIAGIRGVTTGHADAVPVVIDSVGQLGTVSSSRRFKKEIKPMDQTSQAILGLQPVTFQYKSDLSGTAQFGLIAEEVAQVDPDLVVRDAEGEIYTVRYEAVNAMLLNEFLKEHRKVEQLEAAAAHQQKQIEALTAGLQRVSAQVEMSRPAPQMVLNDQ